MEAQSCSQDWVSYYGLTAALFEVFYQVSIWQPKHAFVFPGNALRCFRGDDKCVWHLSFTLNYYLWRISRPDTWWHHEVEPKFTQFRLCGSVFLMFPNIDWTLFDQRPEWRFHFLTTCFNKHEHSQVYSLLTSQNLGSVYEGKTKVLHVKCV